MARGKPKTLSDDERQRRAMSRQMTPGPWRVSGDMDEVTTSPLGILEWSKSICRKIANPFRTFEESAANAKAISAVPEMVAALRLVVKSSEWSCMDTETQGAVMNALSKAGVKP